MTEPASNPENRARPDPMSSTEPSRGYDAAPGLGEGASLAGRLQPVKQALAGAAATLADWTRIAAVNTWIVLKRLPIATYSLIRALADAQYARLLTDIYIDGETTLPGPSPAAQAPLPRPAAQLNEAPPDSALLLLGLLQKEGRLVDFLQESITGYSDQEIGAAARVVHEGCQRVLKDHLSIEPVRAETEGSRITLAPGFDAGTTRPIGNVVGEPPFTGDLVHRGWRADEVRLPMVSSGRDVSILAPAEVEL